MKSSMKFKIVNYLLVLTTVSAFSNNYYIFKNRIWSLEENTCSKSDSKIAEITDYGEMAILSDFARSKNLTSFPICLKRQFQIVEDQLVIINYERTPEFIRILNSAGISDFEKNIEVGDRLVITFAPFGNKSEITIYNPKVDEDVFLSIQFLKRVLSFTTKLDQKEKGVKYKEMTLVIDFTKTRLKIRIQDSEELELVYNYIPDINQVSVKNANITFIEHTKISCLSEDQKLKKHTIVLEPIPNRNLVHRISGWLYPIRVTLTGDVLNMTNEKSNFFEKLNIPGDFNNGIDGISYAVAVTFPPNLTDFRSLYIYFFEDGKTKQNMILELNEIVVKAMGDKTRVWMHYDTKIRNARKDSTIPVSLFFIVRRSEFDEDTMTLYREDQRVVSGQIPKNIKFDSIQLFGHGTLLGVQLLKEPYFDLFFAKTCDFRFYPEISVITKIPFVACSTKQLVVCRGPLTKEMEPVSSIQKRTKKERENEQSVSLLIISIVNYVSAGLIGICLIIMAVK